MTSQYVKAEHETFEFGILISFLGRPKIKKMIKKKTHKKKQNKKKQKKKKNVKMPYPRSLCGRTTYFKIDTASK